MRDRDVRVAVRRWLDTLHAGDENTRVVEEMGIWAGSVRIDVAVINGELHGFELKSARDTLGRLPGQASLYSEVFDRVTLVAAEKHLEKAAGLIPNWWGLSRAIGDSEIQIDHVRAPERNPNPNLLQVARLLWRAEMADILELHGLIRGVKSKPADILAHRLAAELPADLLRFEVRAALKARQNWLRQAVAHQ